MLKRPRIALIVVFVLRTVSILSLLGFVSWILLFVVSIIVGPEKMRIFDTVEFPLPDMQVIVDEDDRLYVSIGTYGRVQVYEQTGRFLGGFFVGVPQARSLIGFDANGHIVVAVDRSDQIFVFTTDGALLAEKRGGREMYASWKEKPQWAHDSAGREYVARGRALNPILVRVAPIGDEVVVLSNPFYLWPLVAPLPCILSIILTQVISNRIERRYLRNKASVTSGIVAVESANLTEAESADLD